MGMLKPQTCALRDSGRRDKTLLKKKKEDRAQKPTIVDICFGLVRSHQHVTAGR